MIPAISVATRKKVFLDSGYIGCHKRAEIQAIPFKDVSWYIAARPSTWKKELSISENFGGELGQAFVECVNVKRQLEHAKASVRCSIEWCFLWLKRIYGYAKGSSSKPRFNFDSQELLAVTQDK